MTLKVNMDAGETRRLGREQEAASSLRRNEQDGQDGELEHQRFWSNQPSTILDPQPFFLNPSRRIL